MAKIKFFIHPLFLAFGIYFAFQGKVFSFLIFTLSAVVHEMGHSLVAQRLGYGLKRIVLMPYGAVVYGDTCDMSYRDEAVIAISGPFVSLFAAISFVSLWWLVPDLYPYTEVCVLANLTIATINLIPAYPLDGGRVFLSLLSCYIRRKTAIKIVKGGGIFMSISLFALFVYSIFLKSTNYSILFFSGFILFGNIFVSRDLRYERIKGYFSLCNLNRGKKVNVIALSSDITVKGLKDKYRFGELFTCYVYDERARRILTLYPEDVVKILSSEKLYDKVTEVYKNNR